MMAATEVYQPLKAPAKLVKWVACQMLQRGKATWLGAPLVLASTKPSLLEALVREITGETQPLFALSFGRRAAVRKLTVQALRANGEILGYIKIPLTAAATERVVNEARALARLSQFAELRPHIPRLLYAGNWSSGYILFQTPLGGLPGPIVLSSIHDLFLDRLRNAHRVEKPGQSLVEEIGAQWAKAVPRLDSKWETSGREALRAAARLLGSGMVECGIAHGDFAPWNTRVLDDRLLVFDWESTQWDAPKFWDVFHFNSQIGASSLGKGLELRLGPKDRASYILYLLKSAMQFLEEKNPHGVAHRHRALMDALQEPAVTVSESNPATEVKSTRSTSIHRKIRGPASAVKRIVTTSWDDGDPQDRRIADLLKARGMAGTFYIPLSGYLKRPTLTSTDIRTLASDGFEVGAHSVSHQSLTHFSTRREVEHEVSTCKDALEQLIGREVPMFCYPNGRYDARVVREVQRAGYKGARTTRMFAIASGFDPFEMPTTIQAFPHRSSGYIRNLGRAKSAPGLWRFTTQLRGPHTWLDVGRQLFDQVMKDGGIWHLYGHSWEIEENRLWSQLSTMLDYVAHRADVLYVSNSQVLPLVARSQAPAEAIASAAL